MKNAIVVSLGEMLARFSAPRGVLLKEAGTFTVLYGGAEANVLVSLSSLGFATRYLTRLSSSDLGEAALRFLKGYDIDTSFVLRDPRPLGEYFLEDGEGSRPSKCIYHRGDSAAIAMSPSDFPWDEVFHDAALFHGSGVTLALSASAAETLIVAMGEAKARGIKTSFDFNYRSHMLSLEKAKEIYPRIAENVDICFCSAWDLQTLLGFEPEEKDEDRLFQDACRHFGWDYIFTKKRKILSARRQNIEAIGYTAEKKFAAPKHRFEIYGRIGAGDAFAAGAIAGLLLNYEDGKKALDYGTANCILKQSISGDQSKFTVEDLERYLSSAGPGEVIR